MILIKSQSPVRPIKIKYMTEEGIKVSARPILVLTCFSLKCSLNNRYNFDLARFTKVLLTVQIHPKEKQILFYSFKVMRTLQYLKVLERISQLKY